MKTRIKSGSILLVLFLLGAATETNAQVAVVRRGAVVVRHPYVRPVHPVVRVPAPRPVVVYPRPGVVVAALPAYYSMYYRGGVPYYYSDGIYYVKEEKNDSYKVVQPPVGTLVPVLPEEAKQNVLDGRVYYEFQNVIYKEVQTEEGLKYEVVGYTNN